MRCSPPLSEKIRKKDNKKAHQEEGLFFEINSKWRERKNSITYRNLSVLCVLDIELP